jgi:hypothetical protein
MASGGFLILWNDMSSIIKLAYSKRGITVCEKYDILKFIV